MNLSELTRIVGDTNKANGWHDRLHDLVEAHDEEGQREHIVAKLALITSEVSEAVEDVRAGRSFTDTHYTVGGHQVYRVRDGSGADWTTDRRRQSLDEDVKTATWTGITPKPEGFPSELADVIIRCLDLSYQLDIDIEKVVEEKLAYNATRGKMHGGKKL